MAEAKAIDGNCKETPGAMNETSDEQFLCRQWPVCLSCLHFWAHHPTTPPAGREVGHWEEEVRESHLYSINVGVVQTCPGDTNWTA